MVESSKKMLQAVFKAHPELFVRGVPSPSALPEAAWIKPPSEISGDKKILHLRSGVMVDGIKVAAEEGTPQGGPLSPLLSNIVLDELDKKVMKRRHRCGNARKKYRYMSKMKWVAIAMPEKYFIAKGLYLPAN